jgi:hypothetical protein
MKIFLEFLERRKKQRDDSWFQQGYEFAAGACLAGSDHHALRIAAEVTFEDETPFDRGMLSAIKAYEKLLEKAP